MTEQEKPKRKTHTSTEVKQRYNKKTYQLYAINLRKVEDADCIEFIEQKKNEGYTISEIVKKLIRN